MKKQFLLTILCISLILKGYSQIATLQSADFNSIDGEAVGVGHGLFTGPGNAGPAVTWNFTSLIGITPFFLTTSAMPNTTFTSSFPGADYAVFDGVYNKHYVYSNSSTAYFLNGEVDIAIKVYSNKKKLLKFPFTYLDGFTDLYEGTWSDIVGQTTTREGSIVVEVDAYGTLILPYGTVSDVIRVKSVDTYTDSTYFLSSSTVLETVVTNYKWYKEGIRVPILEISSGIINGAAQYDPHTTLISQSVALDLNLIDNPQEVFLYPNPTNGLININNIPQDAQELKIYNALGQMVYSSNVLLKEIDLSLQPKGLYFITLNTSNKVYTHSFIKQ
jgi:hypothetical protein